MPGGKRSIRPTNHIDRSDYRAKSDVIKNVLAMRIRISTGRIIPSMNPGTGSCRRSAIKGVRDVRVQ